MQLTIPLALLTQLQTAVLIRHRHLLLLRKSLLKILEKKTDSLLKIALINFQSIREKRPLFYTFIDLNKPDIIVGTETWLTAEIHDNEIFSPELGVTNSHLYLDQNLIPIAKTYGSRAKSVLIGAYYKPHKADPESIASFEELKKSLTLVNQTNSAVWLLGDFYLPEIDWENLIPSPEYGHPTFYRDCLEVLDGCLLEQMVTSPTRVKLS